MVPLREATVGDVGPHGAAGVAGRGGFRAADRLRQCGQPAAGARRRPAAGAGHSRGHRRRPLARRPAIAHRKRDAGRRRAASSDSPWAPGACAACCCWRRATFRASRTRRAFKPPFPRSIGAWRPSPSAIALLTGHRVRPLPRPAHLQPRPGLHAQRGQRPLGHRPAPESRPLGARGIGDRAGAGAAHRRRPAHPHVRGTALGEPGLRSAQHPDRCRPPWPAEPTAPPPRWTQFVTASRRAASEALPGVEAAASAIMLPVQGGVDLPFTIAGKPPAKGHVQRRRAVALGLPALLLTYSAFRCCAARASAKPTPAIGARGRHQ